MSTIQACRMCLNVEARLQSIANTPLQEIYERITNIPLQTEDRRPAMACYICHHMLKKCKTFINRSVEADGLLKQILDKGSKLTKTSINKLKTDKLRASLDISNPSFLNVQPEIFEICVKQEVKSEDDDEPELVANGPEVFVEIADPLVANYPESADEVQTEEDTMSMSENATDDGTTTTASTNVVMTTIAEESEQTSGSWSGSIPSTKKSKRTKKVQMSKLHASPKETQISIKRKLNKVQKKIPGEKLFQCMLCGKIFKRKSRLVLHMKIHTGERPFHCSYCRKAFGRKDQLARHTKTHTGEKPHPCTMCKKAFHRKDKLMRHIKTHDDEQPFRCKSCDKVFNRKCNLSKHVNFHHSRQEP